MLESSAPRPLTVRQVLSGLWGPLDPPTEAALLEDGVDLEAVCAYPPWTEVAETFHKGMFDLSDKQVASLVEGECAWPDSLSNEWVKSNFGVPDVPGGALSPQQLSELDNLTANQSAEIAGKATEFSYGVRDALRQTWSEDRYFKSPYSTLPIKRPSGSAFFASAMATSGWGAKVYLFPAEYPALAELKNEIAALRNARRGIVERYLRTLDH